MANIIAIFICLDFKDMVTKLNSAKMTRISAINIGDIVLSQVGMMVSNVRERTPRFVAVFEVLFESLTMIFYKVLIILIVLLHRLELF